MTVRCTHKYRSNRVYSEGEIIQEADLAAWVKRDAPSSWEDVVEAGATPPEPPANEPGEPDPDAAESNDPEVEAKPFEAAVKPFHRGPGRSRKFQ